MPSLGVWQAGEKIVLAGRAASGEGGKAGGFPRRLSGAYPTLRFGASFQRGRFALWLRLRCEPGLTAPADGENHSHPPLLAQKHARLFHPIEKDQQTE